MRCILIFIVFSSIGSASFAACNIIGGKAYGDCYGVQINTGRSSYREIDAHAVLTGVSEGATVLSGGSL